MRVEFGQQSLSPIDRINKAFSNPVIQNSSINKINKEKSPAYVLNISDDAIEAQKTEEAKQHASSQIDSSKKPPQEQTPQEKEDLQEIRQLESREREVISHEQAHKAAGGKYAGAINYNYTNGPDGKKYKSGGHVSIDVSPEKDPNSTIIKM